MHAVVAIRVDRVYRRQTLREILHGAKPGDLPVEQPTRFEFVWNDITAKGIGVAPLHSVLLRADRVIE